MLTARLLSPKSKNSEEFVVLEIPFWRWVIVGILIVWIAIFGFQRVVSGAPQIAESREPSTAGYKEVLGIEGAWKEKLENRACDDPMVPLHRFGSTHTVSVAGKELTLDIKARYFEMGDKLIVDYLALHQKPMVRMRYLFIKSATGLQAIGGWIDGRGRMLLSSEAAVERADTFSYKRCS